MSNDDDLKVRAFDVDIAAEVSVTVPQIDLVALRARLEANGMPAAHVDAVVESSARVNRGNLRVIEGGTA